MRACFLASAIIAVALADNVMSQDEKTLDSEFASYCAQHGKVYKDVAEYEKRKALYKDMDKFIRRHNNSDSGYKLGHNPFSDMTKEER